MDANIVQAAVPHIPGFVAGVLVTGLGLLVADWKKAKAELAKLKAEAVPTLKADLAAAEHEVHLVEAAPKVAAADVAAIIAKAVANIRAEAAKADAAALPKA